MKALYVLILIGLLFFAFSPINPIEMDFKNEDKLHHIFAFFVLSFMQFNVFKSLNLRYNSLILVLFAIFIEVVQSEIGREFSLYDVVSGIFGIIIYVILNKFINIIKLIDLFSIKTKN